jgi:AAA domain
MSERYEDSDLYPDHLWDTVKKTWVPKDRLRLVVSQPQPNGEAQPFIRKVKRGGDFLAEYTPIVYTFDGLLPSSSIYGVTGRRSTGKTALLQAASLSIISAKNLIGFDPEQGRVAYIILENPTDFRMKLAVNAYIHGVDWETLNDNLAVLDMRCRMRKSWRSLITMRKNWARSG